MRKSAHRIVVLAIALTFSMNAACLADEWVVTVRAGDFDLGETPVVAEVADGLSDGVYQLSQSAGGSPLTAQVFKQDDKRMLAFVLPSASQVTTCSLQVGCTRESWRPTGDWPVDSHRGPEHRCGLRPKIVDGVPSRLRQQADLLSFDRAHRGSLHACLSHGGDPGRRRRPSSSTLVLVHLHGKVNGIDFWSEGGKSGKIKETGRRVALQGPVLAQIQTRDDWFGPDGHRVCSDLRTVTFYHSLESRIIDFEFTIRASDGPLTFGETKEGMFGIRVASSMDVAKKTGGRITNAEGVIDDKAWGKTSPWVDYVGPVNQKTVGIAVLNHPGSFRYPTAWHVRPYGLFAANPFGGHDFGGSAPGEYTVPSSQAMSFRYRVILHEGDTKAAAIDRAFGAYSKPPTVEIARK